MASGEHKKYVSLMNKVLDGEATKEEQCLLDAHLAGCSSCRDHFNELRQYANLLNQLVHPQVPINFTKNVLDKLPADHRHAVRNWAARHPLYTGMAICALPMSLMMIAARRQASDREKSGNGQFILLKMPGDRS
ncbi:MULTISPECIES: anti-sigma factor family protein [unclassified Sporolactobacillus]|uniref:anti-sigma factor family protein n=1 Tax=unclassified Sporolactobacillus TaxID=2628533 RepID=UPI0023680850|nr:zf-HC2 domain-containing protein [Sporolactobacillus sp. CQH2019]MDD9150002.1 zf-HC2 domain-containing protein [Sporolactobacillus sp. CQH2019]